MPLLSVSSPLLPVCNVQSVGDKSGCQADCRLLACSAEVSAHHYRSAQLLQVRPEQCGRARGRHAKNCGRRGGGVRRVPLAGGAPPLRRLQALLWRHRAQLWDHSHRCPLSQRLDSIWTQGIWSSKIISLAMSECQSILLSNLNWLRHWGCSNKWPE